jgi:hypothetical protein
MEPLMTDHLATLIKLIAKLRQAGLEACHYIEEFHLQQIHPLGRQKTLTFKCPWMADPSRDPSKGDVFVLSSHY